ncbi:unnamed protein product [Diabrotica balteata]|uniref:Isopropylmalate dehydrogenase-like domain-containing protein n=1 Tax=Diabrotica balteata TaxID=107213 RepID=A0A9N9T5B3_DIABA|nr:unnamed protein product [Diabrotica balteata]
MNKLAKHFGNLVLSRHLATAADTFAGLVKNKQVPIWSTLSPPPENTHGGRRIVTMLPGIGSGPQMMEYVKEIFEAAYVPIDFEVVDESDEIALLSIRRNGVAIKGHIPSLADTSSNVNLRAQLDLFVYLVHCTSYPNVRCRFPALDIYLLRQNTEGEYAMLEHESKPGIVESLKIITRENSERFGRWAFEFASKNGRKKVTIVHKANIMKLSDGLFLNTLLEISKDYPDIIVNDLIVDNCCMQIVSNPGMFDVIVTPNLYGNILTSIICGLIGGPGLISGQNYGNNSAVFEVASRHLAFEDKRYVNPIAMINAAVNMLFYLQKEQHALLICEAIYKTLVDEKIHTPDIGGENTGAEMVKRIIKNIREGLKTANIRTF